ADFDGMPDSIRAHVSAAATDDGELISSGPAATRGALEPAQRGGDGEDNRVSGNGRGTFQRFAQADGQRGARIYSWVSVGGSNGATAELAKRKFSRGYSTAGAGDWAPARRAGAVLGRGAEPGAHRSDSSAGGEWD